MKLQGKVLAVTGGGNGIGREVVLALLDRGARVAALDRREDSLAETARIAGEPADRLSVHTVDITDRTAVEALPGRVVAALGQVDGLLNVAGIIQQFTPFADLAYEEIERVLAVNFWGVVHTTKAFLPHLMGRPEACIVNVSSMGGSRRCRGRPSTGRARQRSSC